MQPMSSPRRIVAIVGETATGKTGAAETVAGAIGGEIVCADSRQVFAELDVGTGKPSAAERAALPHHLFDTLHVGDAASAGWYLGAARSICAEIHARGAVPVLVGGSGLYLEAAREGIAAAPPADPAMRAALRAEAADGGPAPLHARLATADPETAARLAPRDAQRVIRALEVLEASGRPLSWWHRQPRTPPVAGEWRVFRIRTSIEALRGRIERRAAWMFDSGLIEETRVLLASERGPALRALRAIGYDEAALLLEGGIDRAGAVERTALRTHQLAKRQRTWFRHRGRSVDVAAAAAPAAILDALRAG